MSNRINIFIDELCNELKSGKLAFMITLKNIEIVSTNHMYYYGVSRNRKVYKTKSVGMLYLQQVVDIVFKDISESSYSSMIKYILESIISNNGKLIIKVKVPRSKLYYNNGNRKLYDTSNRIKSIEDCIVNSINKYFDLDINNSIYDDNGHDLIVIKREELSEGIVEEEIVDVLLYSISDSNVLIDCGTYNFLWDSTKKEYYIMNKEGNDVI